MPVLSVIIPLKLWEDERLVLLLNSICYLKKHHIIEIVIIYSGKSPQVVFQNHNIQTDNVQFIYSAPKGIYNAFNLGIKYATGRWIMFFGGDDLLLPSLDDLLTQLIENNESCDAVVCNVVFGNNGLFCPLKFRYGLVFRNWCQQGVLYNRNIFRTLSFDEKYTIQADHKFNIELASRTSSKIIYSNALIAYFNTSGISQSTPDNTFRRDMPLIVSSNFGLIWCYVSILRRAFGTLKRSLKS